MRTSSGNLHIPKKMAFRPTSSKVRAQVFNILQQVIVDAVVLDLFAGSGAIGFEALSRGAETCTFCELDKKTTALLHSNIKKLHYEEHCTVLTKDAMKALLSLSTHKPFSFVYIDPPYTYGSSYVQSILHTMEKNLPLSDDAVIFVEVRKQTFTPPALSSLSLCSRRQTGETELYLFKKNPI